MTTMRMTMPAPEVAVSRVTALRVPQPRSLAGPLIVVGDEGHAASGALHVAELLARRDRVNAQVIGFVRPVGAPVWAAVDVDPSALEDGRRRQHRERLRRRLHRTIGRGAHFSIEVVTGSPAPLLAAAARERGAECILVGLAEPGADDRRASEDAVLQLTSVADVPVLAVPPDQLRLPRHALVAMDFSESSRRAVRAAVRLLAPAARLTIAHIQPDADLRPFGGDGWVEIYERGVAMLLEEVADAARMANDLMVETVVLKGEPAAALLDFAERARCDLIASGTQGASPLERHVTMSVSAALLRGARRAVLIAPPAESSLASTGELR